MYTIYEFWYSPDLQSHNGPTAYNGHALSFQFLEHAYRAAGEVALQGAIDRDACLRGALDPFHQVVRGYFFVHDQQCPAFHVGAEQSRFDIPTWIVTFYVVEE